MAALLASVNLEADVNHRSSTSDADIIIIIVAVTQSSILSIRWHIYEMPC